MFKKSFKFLTIACCAVMLLGGCGNNEDANNDATNTSTGSSANNTSSSSSTTKTYTAEQLESNIVSSEAITKNNRLVVFVTNNNDVTVNITVEVEYYDENGLILDSSEDALIAVGANTEVVFDMYKMPDNYATYKVYIDVEQTESWYITYFDQISITHNDNGEDVVVQVTNNSSDEIESMTVMVVYYSNGEVVGIGWDWDSDIKSGRSGNFTFSYPYDTNYDEVSFDTYKVYVVEATSYNW